MTASAKPEIAEIYRAEWGRVVATLIKQTHDFSLAEEVAQEAFAAALVRWSEDGVPEHPRGWLIQTARHLALDRLRRSKVLANKLERYAADLGESSAPHGGAFEIEDDRLRLVFTCCHPALAVEAQIALTLRTLLGLETDEIARAFLVPPATMAQRLVRAKRKISDAKIPYVVPETGEIEERLHAVLTVIYLVFTEGYAATRGASMLRVDLSSEAIRLARLVCALMAPTVPSEAIALLALLLLQDSRRAARVDEHGDLVLLDEQDRTKWDRAEIDEALALLEAVRRAPDLGPFGLQAAIAAEHARAARKEDTDWRAILALYDVLLDSSATPVVRLNRAVAVAMVDGPVAGLAVVDELGREGTLDSFHLLHAARADFLHRLGRDEESAQSYRRALDLVQNETERRFLERRLSTVEAASGHLR